MDSWRSSCGDKGCAASRHPMPRPRRNGRRSLAAAIVSLPMRRRGVRIRGQGRNLAYRVRLVTGAGAKIKLGPERQVDMAAPPLRQATTRQIRSALVVVFDQKPDNPPNINTMCPLVKEELGQLGLRASNRQIQDVGEEPGLKLRRRPTGQHTKKR